MATSEIKRIDGNNTRVLAALQRGSKTNVWLSSHVSLDYGRCIRKLRQAGYNIWGRRLRGGLFRYTLKAHTDPVWLVKARVTLADGRTFVQWVAVNACDEGTARNRAQHKVTKVKILKSKLKE